MSYLTYVTLSGHASSYTLVADITSEPTLITTADGGWITKYISIGGL